MGRREDLLRQEAEGWARIDALVEGLAPEDVDRPGLTDEGWSVKDMMWHVAAWSDDTARVLRDMEAGTWDGEDPSAAPGYTDRVNREWFAALAHDGGRGGPLGLVRDPRPDARGVRGARRGHARRRGVVRGSRVRALRGAPSRSAGVGRAGRLERLAEIRVPGGRRRRMAAWDDGSASWAERSTRSITGTS